MSEGSETHTDTSACDDEHTSAGQRGVTGRSFDKRRDHEVARHTPEGRGRGRRDDGCAIFGGDGETIRDKSERDNEQVDGDDRKLHVSDGRDDVTAGRSFDICCDHEVARRTRSGTGRGRRDDGCAISGDGDERNSDRSDGDIDRPAADDCKLHVSGDEK